MNAVRQPTVVDILADLKADLFGSDLFEREAFDDACTEDRYRLHGFNAGRPADSKIIATPRMRDDYFRACADKHADDWAIGEWTIEDAERFADKMRREFVL